MVQQPIEDISQALDDIEARVEYIESSQDRTFALIENETLSSFHYFNLCLKLFWDDFDRNSVSNLMQYQYIVERYSDLRNRYITLFRERISYWDEVLNLDTESVQKLAPFILVDDSEQKVIGYYNRFLSSFKNKKGEPLYKIDENTNPSIIFVDEQGNPRKHYALHSDILNFGHYRSLDSIRNCLKYIFDMMDVVCSYPDEYFSKYKPTQEDIICALENGLRQYAKDVGNKVERQLKRTTQKLKPSRSAPLTPEVWGEMMDREDAMFDQAIRTQVGEIDDDYLENISVTKIQLIDNYALLQKIKTTCLDGELFDIRLSVKTHQLLTSLDYNNLDFFYELVLRRNIIQREMFPDELRDKYEEWLNPVEEKQEDNSDKTYITQFPNDNGSSEEEEVNPVVGAIHQLTDVVKESLKKPRNEFKVYPQPGSTANLGCDQKNSDFKTYLPGTDASEEQSMLESK